MKTIKSLKDITTLEVGDVVVFGDLEYKVYKLKISKPTYFLVTSEHANSIIFNKLKLNKLEFCSNLGIEVNTIGDFPETKSLEALTAIVSALFKEYEKQNEFPKTWEEFCKNTPIQKGECLIDVLSKIKETRYIGSGRDVYENKNYYTSKQEAEAFLALMQLRQLRKVYIKNWEPDYKSEYFGIYPTNGDFSIMRYTFTNRSLSFPTYELAEQFLTNFNDLLEVAKPLL